MNNNSDNDTIVKNDHSAMNAITIDCVIFGFDKGSLEVLLVQHGEGISKGKWGLPGGWINKK